MKMKIADFDLTISEGDKLLGFEMFPPYELSIFTLLSSDEARELGTALLHFAEHGTLPSDAE